MPTAAAKRRVRQGAPAPTREVILDTAERLFAARGMTLLTRDPARYRTYFPTLRVIAPG